MKKKLISLITGLMVLMMLGICVSAKTAYVNDYANLFTSTQRQELTARADSFRESYGLDVVILTAPDLYGKSPMAFADDFYDNNGYHADGVLFLVDMGSRQWHLSTSGGAIEALSDRDLEYIEERVVPYLSEGRYYDAFAHFLDILPGRLAIENTSAVNLGLSLIAGAAVAGISLLVMRSNMNTGKPQRSAAGYQTEGSYRLRQYQDLFLYSNVSKRQRPQNNGGSSTHRGSSGRSHGGRGGGF